MEASQLGNAGTASGAASTAAANAGNLYGSLAPQLQAEVSNPQGYGAPALAKMNTAGQQSAGGTQAGAVGQGALLAARTRNAGTADAAIGQSARTAGQQASDAALKTQVGNAQLQQQQRQAGLSGLQGLNATELGASNSALGISNQALSGATSSAAANPWNPIFKQYGLNAVNNLNGPGA